MNLTDLHILDEMEKFEDLETRKEAKKEMKKLNRKTVMTGKIKKTEMGSETRQFKYDDLILSNTESFQRKQERQVSQIHSSLY